MVIMIKKQVYIVLIVIVNNSTNIKETNNHLKTINIITLLYIEQHLLFTLQ